MPCFFPQETNGTDLAYLELSNCELPAPPIALKYLRHTSFDDGLSLDTVTSEEITSTRDIVDRFPVGGQIAPSIGIHFLYKEYDAFLAAVMQNDWVTKDLTIGDLSVTSTTVFSRATGSFINDGIIKGIWVKIAGFSNPENNGFFKVLAVTATTLTVRSPFSVTPLVVESAVSATLKAKWLTNGSTRKTFYLEDKYSVPGKFVGMYPSEVNQFDLDFASRSVINGTISMLGGTPEVLSATKQTTPPITPSEVFDIMNTSANISWVGVNGIAVPGNVAEALSISINNNQEVRNALGKQYGVGNRNGAFEVTFNLNLYLVSLQQRENWINNIAGSLDWATFDKDSNGYIWDVPKYKWTNVPTPKDGLNADVFLGGEAGAIRDPDTGASFIINAFGV